MLKNVLFCALMYLCLLPSLFGETIILKSGQKVEGKIIEETEKYIKIDFDGVPLTYFLDEVESIDGKPANVSKDLFKPKDFDKIAVSAEKESSEYLEKNPQSAEAYNKRGVAYRMNGNQDDAIACFNKAIEIDPNNAQYYQHRGISYSSSAVRKYDQAIADFTKAIEIDPSNSDFYFHRALTYYEKKEYDKSWEDVRKADSLGFKKYFKSYGGLYPRFINDLIKASGKNPYASAEESDAFKKGLDFSERGLLDESIREFSKVIQINPNSIEAYYNRALAYEKKEKFNQAITDYSRVIESYPEYAQAYVGRGVNYAQKGEEGKALDDFNRAIQLDPKHFFAYYNRGLAYVNGGEYDQAIADFTKAIEINPNDSQVYNDRAVSYFFAKDYEKSWQDVHKAKELGKDVHPGFLMELKKASGRNN
jgi:tetratricopeptide (TPR) repeat protein